MPENGTNDFFGIFPPGGGVDEINQFVQTDGLYNISLQNRIHSTDLTVCTREKDRID